MKWSVVVASVAMLAMLAAPASAGDWSAEQKAVWSVIEGYWEDYASGDVDGFLANMHDDYRGWSYDQPLPSGKKTAEKWMKFGMPKRETLIYEITPTAIVVGNGFAVAHYYFEYVYTNAEGEMKDASGRWTDVLAENDGAWMLIADHGGQVDDD
jgi:ketosteroid isomerase-like protein